MPNWVSNKLQLTHDNPAVIAEAIEGFKAGDFFQTLLPCPQELLDAVKGFSRDNQDEIDRVAAANMDKYGFPTWYEFKTEIWGTKWDVGGDGGKVDQVSDNTVILDFDSAWSPPVAAYAKLEALGFNIRAQYYEPGMCFCGEWVTGAGDSYMEFEYDADWIRENVPSSIEEAFGIADQIAAFDYNTVKQSNMGWWGYDIMEGDGPLDCQGDIIDFVADPVLVAAVDTAENWMDATDEVEQSGFLALQNEATVRNVYRAIQDGELCSYDTNIAMQVLGEMVMCSGGAFPQAARAACVAAAEAEIEYGDKGWRTEGAREKCLKAYIARVWAYVDGTAIEPTSEGLFAKMSQAIEAGEQRLINTQGAA